VGGFSWDASAAQADAGKPPARLRELRRAGVIGDDAFHRLEEELDLADLAVDRRESRRK